MARVPITVMGYHCERCAHEWIPANFTTEPDCCPECQSRNWNKPRSPMLTYDVFRDKIVEVLRQTSPLTWTEIRTKASLPQKFPNNEWVRRLERDIGLDRNKDAHGIINWQLMKTA